MTMAMLIRTLKAQGRASCRRFVSSGRFSGHGFSGRRWRVDVHIELLGSAAVTAPTAATITISHIHPLSCTHDSLLVGYVTVFGD